MPGTLFRNRATDDVDAIKTAIMTYGVVDAAVYVSDAFEAYESGVYEDTSTTCPDDPCYYTSTNHAIALVGWDDNGDADNEGYWILRNSWGTDWGEDGYMRIKYHAARVACEVSYLVYGEKTPQPQPNYPIYISVQTLLPVTIAEWDLMILTASVPGPVLTPVYPFIRILTPSYGTLYLASGGRLSSSPTPFLPSGPVTIPTEVAEYSLGMLEWQNIQPGDYTIEAGTADATRTTSEDDISYVGEVYYRPVEVQSLSSGE